MVNNVALTCSSGYSLVGGACEECTYVEYDIGDQSINILERTTIELGAIASELTSDQACLNGGPNVYTLANTDVSTSITVSEGVEATVTFDMELLNEPATLSSLVAGHSLKLCYNKIVTGLACTKLVTWTLTVACDDVNCLDGSLDAGEGINIPYGASTQSTSDLFDSYACCLQVDDSCILYDAESDVNSGSLVVQESDQVSITFTGGAAGQQFYAQCTVGSNDIDSKQLTAVDCTTYGTVEMEQLTIVLADNQTPFENIREQLNAHDVCFTGTNDGLYSNC